MSVQILREVNDVFVQVLNFDAVIAYDVKYAADVTEHAVEDGSVIADHTIRQPVQITITAYITNYPVTILTGGIIPARNDGRARNAYEELKGLINTPERVTIQHDLDQNDSMLLTEITIPRDKVNHNGLRFTASFRKVRVVATQEIELDDADLPIAKKKADRGVVTPEVPSPAVESRGSGFYRALEFFGVF